MRDTRHLYLLQTKIEPQIRAWVDSKTGYRTRSILAVPVKGPTGKILGVLQLLNKMLGSEADASCGAHGRRVSEEPVRAFPLLAHRWICACGHRATASSPRGTTLPTPKPCYVLYCIAHTTTARS